MSPTPSSTDEPYGGEQLLNEQTAPRTARRSSMFETMLQETIQEARNFGSNYMGQYLPPVTTSTNKFYSPPLEIIDPVDTPASDPPRGDTMLEKILRWYHAAMAGNVRSPLIHLVGPPGCGKSHSVKQAAELLGVNLHIMNVSRMSPLELEGVQMPVDSNTRLEMLTATWWTQLKEGDIVLLDEFLRGFPEIYNGLLDILTSRRVGAFALPKVFFIGASNSTSTYDKALEDRLLHITAPDPRNNKSERKHIAKLLVEATGMHPDMLGSFQMEDLLKAEILPTYDMLDVFLGKPNVSAQSIKGHSVRNIIGQVRLREFASAGLRELIAGNNSLAIKKGQYQYVILLNGKNPDPIYEDRARKLVGNDKLTEIQAQNLELNIQLIEMERALHEYITITKEEDDDDPLG